MALTSPNPMHRAPAPRIGNSMIRSNFDKFSILHRPTATPAVSAEDKTQFHCHSCRTHDSINIVTISLHTVEPLQSSRKRGLLGIKCRDNAPRSRLHHSPTGAANLWRVLGRRTTENQIATENALAGAARPRRASRIGPADRLGHRENIIRLRMQLYFGARVQITTWFD